MATQKNVNIARVQRSFYMEKEDDIAEHVIGHSVFQKIEQKNLEKLLNNGF